jgi:EKC/KEOPS complex subunit PCC1/LAGE3
MATTAATAATDSAHPFRSELKVQFGSAEEALMVKTALEVDEELQPTRVSRCFTVTRGGGLTVSFAAADLKLLRVSMSGVFDSLTLTAKTLNEFYDKPCAS